MREFDPATGRFGEPFAPSEFFPPVRIGELPTSVLSSQPGGHLALVTTPYGISGSKYYIYDRETGEATYFARSEGGPINATWHPLGHTLYYSVNGPMQYAYDVQTDTHHLLPGGFPDGVWSPDGRYRINWFHERTDDQRARVDAGDLLLKLERWDSQTGASRRYCLPETGVGTYGNALHWSPDGRYVAFTVHLPIEGDLFPTPGPTAVPLHAAADGHAGAAGDAIRLQFRTHGGVRHRKRIRDGHQHRYSHTLILWTDDGGAR